MRRWTDGKSWSASRVNGSFLTYREMEGKRSAGSYAVGTPTSRAPDGSTSRDAPQDQDSGGADGPDGYRYKPDGLTKQSFSITTSQGQHLHLISYFARSHLNSSTLRQPNTDPTLRHIRPAKGMYPESTLQDHSNTPALTRSPMVAPPYAGSPDQSAASTPQYAQSRSQSHAYPAGYAWPHSPMNTPPTSHYSPFLNGHPSGQMSHSPLYQYQSAYPPHHQRVPPGPTAFDRMPPQPSRNGPPPPHYQQNSYPPPPPTSTPAYQYPPPPPTSMPYPPYYPPPSNQLAPLRQSSPHQSNIDPALPTHPPTTQPKPLEPTQSSPKPNAQVDTATTQSPPRSTAGVIPSIGALINKSPPPEPQPSSNDRPPLTDRPSFKRLRSEDQSYYGTHQEKKPYAEDTKALRQLDRAFAA